LGEEPDSLGMHNFVLQGAKSPGQLIGRILKLVQLVVRRSQLDLFILLSLQPAQLRTNSANAQGEAMREQSRQNQSQQAGRGADD
jgi:hypothetical protein